MHPILIDFGWLEIRSYGFMLALSFLFGIYVAGRRARRYGVQPQYILDLSVYIILGAVVGSRLLYVAFHLEQYSNPLEIFALWQGGATFYGGLILAAFVSYVYVTRRKLKFLQVADIVSPSIALGVGITRVGCFLSGCCYGKPTIASFGVNFPPHSPAGQSAAGVAAQLGVATVALHPAQLYASAYGVIMFVALLVLERHLMKRGATFGLLLIMYGVSRFIVDFFRYYEENARVILGLSFNQVISVILVAGGLYLLMRATSERNKIVSPEAATG